MDNVRHPFRHRKRSWPWVSALVSACLLQVPAFILSARDGPAIAAGPLPAGVVDAIPVPLDPSAKQNLIASGNCSSYFQEPPKADLCPSPAAAADIIRSLDGLHPNIGVQTLVVAAMPANLIPRADRDLVLYNLIHQFRSMEGIPYFSATHGKMRAFFTSSHLVKGPGDPSVLSDPHYLSIEPTHGFYVEQNDTTFGKNLYAVTVKGLQGGATELAMSNVQEVKYDFVPVLGPGALKLTMVIQPSADGRYLYFYGNVGIKASALPGLEGVVRTSFHNRILALYNWFAKLAAQV